MKSASRSAPVTLFFAILAITMLLGGCREGAASPSRNPMTILSPRLQAVLENMRTVCIGRFVMRVPATATVVYGPAEVETRIVYFEGEAGKLAEHVAARLAEVEQERRYLLKDEIPRLPLLGTVVEGARPGQKIVFGARDAGYTVHSFIPVGKDLFVQDIDSVLPDEDIVPLFNDVARHLQSRAADEVPAGPGSCIDGGFVDLSYEHERVTVGIRLKELPDVHLSVDMHKNLDRLRKDNSPILLREEARQINRENGLGAVFARTKILRQHERQLGIWKGEELALRTPAYKDDLSVHEFRYHSVGAVHAPLQPELDIRFDSGLDGNRKARAKPSLTDEEALALWDALITSIRVRQPGDATPPKPAPPVPLGSNVRSGEPCPATGWWECMEYQARRLVSAGERMPYVVLRRERGLWQTLAGKREQTVATRWQLADYADPADANVASAVTSAVPASQEKS